MSPDQHSADQHGADRHGPVSGAFVPIRGLHHFAYRCRDAEETRQFYEDVLGLPLAHIVQEDHVPSTGHYCPYVHIFFELGDGSFIAFFDLGDDLASDPSPNTPSWVNHLALSVDSVATLQLAKQRLEDAGIEVVGVTDHGFINSIYFFDPNGIRLELTTPLDAEWNRHTEQGYADLKLWVETKEKAKREGRDPAKALLEMIHESKKRYAEPATNG